MNLGLFFRQSFLPFVCLEVFLELAHWSFSENQLDVGGPCVGQSQNFMEKFYLGKMTRK